MTNLALLNIRVSGSTCEGQEKGAENERVIWATLGALKEEVSDTGCEGVDWIDLAWDKVKWKASENTAINILGP